MANEKDDEQFGKQSQEKELGENKQQPAGQQGQQPELGQQGQQNEFGQNLQQPSGQQGQSSSGQTALGRAATPTR